MITAKDEPKNPTNAKRVIDITSELLGIKNSNIQLMAHRKLPTNIIVFFEDIIFGYLNI